MTNLIEALISGKSKNIIPAIADFFQKLFDYVLKTLDVE